MTGNSMYAVSRTVTVCVLTSTRVLSETVGSVRTVPQAEAARSRSRGRKFFIG